MGNVQRTQTCNQREAKRGRKANRLEGKRFLSQSPKGKEGPSLSEHQLLEKSEDHKLRMAHNHAEKAATKIPFTDIAWHTGPSNTGRNMHESFTAQDLCLAGAVNL